MLTMFVKAKSVMSKMRVWKTKKKNEVSLIHLVGGGISGEKKKKKKFIPQSQSEASTSF